MNPGQILIFVTFLSSLAAAWFFFRPGGDGGGRRKAGARSSPAPQTPAGAKLFQVATVSVVLSSAFLYLQILSNEFAYDYVARYSSTGLPLLYKISAFWAGQEGTFLLWGLLVALLGTVMIRTQGLSSGVAPGLVSLYLAFLHLLMLVKSPFAPSAVVPADGHGMNPLLQDPWMAIHPPILFVGYAAAIVPFALALHGLASRDFAAWKALGFRWTLFSALTLGAGIIIGGFWAYEVLGWGGYWGWDPVENSSLVPWLTLLALVHGLVVEKGKGALRRTNLFLAIISFLLVLYATFLTRSGVLADFSVHSFTDLGINNYLVGVMAAAAVYAFGLLAVRFRSIDSPPIDHRSFNRELFLVLSIYALLAAALFTFAGMSSPIITRIFGDPSQVDVDFYNTVNLPVAIAMALLLGVTPFLGWTGERFGPLAKRLSMPLALTGLSIAIALVAGVRTAPLLLFTAASCFALVSNAIVAFRQYRSGWTALGGPVAHIGVALLLIGIMASGNFTETKQLALTRGEAQGVYGYDVTFTGTEATPDAKNKMLLDVSDGASSFTATPRLYYSEYNQSVMREPHIRVLPLKDLYISPLEMKGGQGEHHHAELEMGMGETKEINGYPITFEKFEMGQHSQTAAMMVGAVLTVPVGAEVHRVVPALSFNANGDREPHGAALPALSGAPAGAEPPTVMLTAMQVEGKRILLEFHGFPGEQEGQAPASLVVEVRMIPMMMVVWTGVVLILAGSVLAFARRLRPEGPSAA